MSDQLEILYRDEYLLAVYKPAGLLVHRTKLAAREGEFLVQKLRDQVGKEVYPCHRLDRATSGVILFALDKAILSQINKLFVSGAIKKKYIALCRGWIQGEGIIDYPLKDEDGQGDSNKLAKIALTSFKPIAYYKGDHPVGKFDQARFTLCRLRPKTGRRHQLRRHLAHLRHPILGDTTHGDGKQNKYMRKYFDCHRLMLSAVGLKFIHPKYDWEISIIAPPDSSFECVLNSLSPS